MCNVCEASKAIDHEVLTTRPKKGKDIYEMKAAATHPEKGPCFYSLRKNGGEWTCWFYSEEELCNIVADGGFDIKPSVKNKEHDKWLESHFDVDDELIHLH